MSTTPIVFENNNLSIAWCEIFEHIINHSGFEITPLLLTLTDFDEIEEVRKKINLSLLNHGFDSIETVSETIFPQSIYQLKNYNRNDLYATYVDDILPRIKKIDKSNSRGTYFQRMIAFEDSFNNRNINQIDKIIRSLLSKRNRRSKLQVSIFDATKDHLNGPYQTFPCLQHVTFYKSENGGLILNGFYASQYLFQRAYGNWLGLINLGKFVAKETNLEFERFNCFIGIEKLDELTKESAKPLLKQLKSSKEFTQRE